MTKLTEAQRNALPNSEFALPDKRKYPVDTPARAANAKARASMMEHEGKISVADVQKIYAKANRVLGK